MPKKEANITGGLQEYIKDPRDFNFGAISTLSAGDIKSLPANYEIPVLYPHNQLNTDFCTGYSVAEASEDQEGQPLHPAFQFAAGKSYVDDYRSWGNSTYNSLKGVVQIGSILLNDAPDMLPGKKTRDFLANWANWPSELKEKAKAYKKQSYFDVANRWGIDYFDSIRLALWENKDFKRTIITGAQWEASWNHPTKGIIPEASSGNTVGHQFEIVGFVVRDGVQYLKVYPNYGADLGEGGYLYMSRSVANRRLLFAYMLVDIPVDVAKLLVKYNKKAVASTTPPTIWFIDQGKKRKIPNVNFLNALGFLDERSDQGFAVVSEPELAAIPEGTPIGVGDLSPSFQGLFNRNKQLIG